MEFITKFSTLESGTYEKVTKIGKTLGFVESNESTVTDTGDY